MNTRHRKGIMRDILIGELVLSGDSENCCDNYLTNILKEVFISKIEPYIEFPCELSALKSNWCAGTGIKIVKDMSELINAVFSFDNEHVKFMQDVFDKTLYFHTSCHDVPCGFSIFFNKFIEEKEGTMVQPAVLFAKPRNLKDLFA